MNNPRFDVDKGRNHQLKVDQSSTWTPLFGCPSLVPSSCRWPTAKRSPRKLWQSDGKSHIAASENMVKFYVCSLTHHFCWLKQVKHVKTICLMKSPSFAGRSNRWLRFLQFHDVPQCSTLHRNLTYFLRHSSFKLICLG